MQNFLGSVTDQRIYKRLCILGIEKIVILITNSMRESWIINSGMWLDHYLNKNAIIFWYFFILPHWNFFLSLYYHKLSFYHIIIFSKWYSDFVFITSSRECLGVEIFTIDVESVRKISNDFLPLCYLHTLFGTETDAYVCFNHFKMILFYQNW